MSADDARVAYPLFQEEYGGSTPTSALQLNITRISVETAVKLNRLWHSRLPYIGNAFRCEAYGAEYNNVYYATALWSSPIARMLNGKNWWELRRMAISDDAPINTASRMLRIMKLDIIKTHREIIKLISYQDIAVHKGTIYKAAGWVNTIVSNGGDGWSSSRNRNKEQTTSKKIRWEYSLNG